MRDGDGDDDGAIDFGDRCMLWGNHKSAISLARRTRSICRVPKVCSNERKVEPVVSDPVFQTRKKFLFLFSPNVSYGHGMKALSSWSQREERENGRQQQEREGVMEVVGGREIRKERSQLDDLASQLSFSLICILVIPD